VIGSQIGQDPLRLRKWTMLKLKNNFQNLAEWIDKILQSERNLMIGGARYIGTWYGDAERILDNSQNNRSTGQWGQTPFTGHPRGHVSNPSCAISVERYSRNEEKSGFLSRADQDYVTHLALKTPIAAESMDLLNNGRIDNTIEIPVEELRQECCDLPKVNVWYNERVIARDVDFTNVVLKLKHHVHKIMINDADVFIQTCFPRVWGN